MRTSWRWLWIPTIVCLTSACFPDLPGRLPINLEPVDVGDEPDIPDGQLDMGPPTDMRVPDLDRGPPTDMDPDEGPPPVERCNGSDDDGDGLVDEQFPVGDDCEAGQGLCLVVGQLRCADDGMGVACDARPGMPQPDVCNGLDDDCSGVIDEDFPEVGDDCTVGAGVCQVDGRLRCSEMGDAAECDVAPDLLRRTLERCNGLDDDCNGVVDDGLTRSCEAAAEGICAPGRSVCAGGQWGPCLTDVEPGDRLDECNLIDDDCDGRVDENDLPAGNTGCLGCDEALPLDGCILRTPCIRQCDLEAGGGVICAPAPEGDCDGRDDDCDGRVDDDGVCGEPMVETCFFGFGWSVDEIPAPAEQWGRCNVEAGGFDDTYSCNRTRSDDFTTIDLPGGVDLDAADDKLGVTFRCSPGATGDYIVATCRIVLGVATVAAGVADGGEAWGPCPAARVGGDDQVACTSSTTDRSFLPMPVPFDLDADSLMGVAFICDDPMDPERAAALQASLAVSLAWADSEIEGETEWQAACAPLGDGLPHTACATTLGDGRFRAMRFPADVDGNDRFAIRLRALMP